MKFWAARRTFEVSLERTEVYTIRRSVRALVEWCDFCESDVEMLEPDAAAIVRGISTRELYLGIEAGELHFRELQDGKVLVCRSSLGEHRPHERFLDGKEEQ